MARQQESRAPQRRSKGSERAATALILASLQGDCPGPNYIVQKIYRNRKGSYETVIVTSSNFDGWFLLSKSIFVSDAKLQVSNYACLSVPFNGS
jgi:hypothetical protein